MKFELLFLGTAASAPSPERGLPALLVTFGHHRVLVDCGEGTQRQILKSGAGLRGLNRILLTHAHLDHVLGLGGLIATLALFDIRGTVTINGGPATLAYAERLLTGGVWGGGLLPVPVTFAPLAPGVLVEDGRFRICAFPVIHGEAESFGFLFEAMPMRHLDAARLDRLSVPKGPARSRLAAGLPARLDDGRVITPEEVAGPSDPGLRLVVVGDAGDTESLVEVVRGADALVIEATFLEADRDKAEKWGHLTARQAAALAAEAGVGQLFLTHLSPRYEATQILAEARAVFPRTRVAADFDHVTIARARRPGSASR